MNVRNFLLFLSVVFVAPLLGAAQCGSKLNDLKNKAAVTVTINRDVEFDVDIDQIVKDANIPKTKDGKIPTQAPKQEAPIDIVQTFDMSDDPNFKKYGRKLIGAKVKSLKLTPVQNSLNVDLPPIEFYVDDVGKKPLAYKIGTLDGIKAKETGTSKEIIKSAAAVATLEKFLLKFKFDFGAKSKLVLKGGDPIPSGLIRLKASFTVEVKIAPLK